MGFDAQAKFHYAECHSDTFKEDVAFQMKYFKTSVS